MPKKKHSTPKKLDYLFERKVITKDQYEDFWSGYWGNRRSREKDRFVDNFISDLQTEIKFGKTKSGTVTISRAAAEDQAKNIGGFVVRRNKQGRFSKTGKAYQAIIRGKRKK